MDSTRHLCYTRVMDAIYLDYNATTPLDPAVSEALRPYLAPGLAGRFGNPSSAHERGHAAHEALAEARSQVAQLLGCAPPEVVFTASGSEADNLAIKGVAATHAVGHIITSVVEHPAVLNTCRSLERRGWRVTYLPVGGDGRVDPAAVERALCDETALVSIMHANNETGALQPIAEIAALAHRRGALMHSDTAQSVGKVDTQVTALGVDLLTVAGHKLYAPKGVGALYVRQGVALEPLVHGAGQEGGRRAGTENVPYIVALGTACRVAAETMAVYAPRLQELRDRLQARLEAAVPGLALNGPAVERLPNTLNVSFPGVDGEALLAATPAVAASTGSACHSGCNEPSAVLTAMGLGRERALGALRLSLGKFTLEEDVERAAAALAASWRRLA
ncbi:MAG TPA: cysteine desulfurase family protein [Anaerolineae bacterium]|nr:cysteine desulfurase family protein [Anaerolineae bacterium]